MTYRKVEFTRFLGFADVGLEALSVPFEVWSKELGSSSRIIPCIPE